MRSNEARKRDRRPRATAFGARALWLPMVMVGAMVVLPKPVLAQRMRGFCSLPELDRNLQPCGRQWQLQCIEGDPCDPGFRAVDFSEVGLQSYTVVCPSPLPQNTVTGTCVRCGQARQVPCASEPSCAEGLSTLTTDGLDGPISACGALLPADPEDLRFEIQGLPTQVISLPGSAALVEAYGSCSGVTPAGTFLTSRQDWTEVAPSPSGRGAVVFIHGEGASCSGQEALLQSDGGMLLERNHDLYCLQYGQEDEPRRVALYVAAQGTTQDDDSNECLASSSCRWDLDSPHLVETAASDGLPAIAAAAARLLAQLGTGGRSTSASGPFAGDLTIIAHGQGGFVLRALVNEHYDALRWSGHLIARAIFLGHPFYGTVVDPTKVAPWLCAARDDFDCEVQRWLWGWQQWLDTSDGHIDNADFPQIEWSTVSGDGVTGNGETEGLPDVSDACLQIFGGVNRADVTGDSKVPIQSASGIDEHGFYPVSELRFDDVRRVECTHDATCLLRELLVAAPERIPAAPARGPKNPGALFFDGRRAQLSGLSQGALANFELEAALTVEAWIWPRVGGQDAMIVNKEGEYELHLVDGELSWALAVSEPRWTSIRTGFVPPLGAWTHVALVFDSATDFVRVYANGHQVGWWLAAGLISDTDELDDFRIGGRELTSELFNGRIDDVRVWSVARSADEIRAGVQANVESDDRTLLGWWRFDDDGGDVVKDSSSYGHDLSLAALLRRPSRVHEDRHRPGGALYFDGVDDGVAVTDVEILQGLTIEEAITIEAWVFPHDEPLSGSGAIVHKEGEYALVRMDSGKVAFALAGTSIGWRTQITCAQLPPLTWSHIALTYDSEEGGVIIYVNGQAAGEVENTGRIGDNHPNEQELWIGTRQLSDFSQWFRGAIDEVRIFNVRRTPAQIAEAATEGPSDLDTDGLVAHWRFDEVSGALAIDASPRARHARLFPGTGLTGQMRTYGPVLPGYPAFLIPEPPPAPPPPPPAADESSGGDSCSCGAVPSNDGAWGPLGAMLLWIVSRRRRVPHRR